MRYVSYFLITLFSVSFSYASEDTEKEFHVDPEIIFKDITNKNVELLKTYFSFEHIAIDINRCNEDTIVLYREESKDSVDKYYEEIYKLKNEQLTKSHTKDIDSSIYADMRLKIEDTLVDIYDKFKNNKQVALSKKEIKNIKIEPILFLSDRVHTILRVLTGKEEELVTIPYGIADNIYYKNYGIKLIITVVVIYAGASSFSQEIKLYKINLQ